MIGLLGASIGFGALCAESIPIPNGSFESPSTLFVNTHVDSWQKAPKPPDYDESGGYQWDQLVGVFKNTAPGAADHLVNCDGSQAAWLFAVPGVTIFQDYNTTDWRSDVPSHAFNALFEVGKSYRLTVGVLGGGGNMSPEAKLELGFYYLDASSNQVTVASTAAVASPESFPNRTNLVDYAVAVPFVMAGDPWAGQNIGIRFRSLVSAETAGGYWDLDNVRLTAEAAPVLALSFSVDGSDLRLAWPSLAGYLYQVKFTEDWNTWQDFESPVAGTGGEVVKPVPMGTRPAVFFGVAVIGAP
jgi:hypothetical protein